MAKHNIVTYNSASKGFETDLGSNTAQIVGSGNNVFSVQSGSTELFSVGTDNTLVTINTNLTSSGDISGSVTSTGSFGRVIFTSISGDASQMTNVNERGHVSGAAQIASRISGAFNAGFEILGDLSGSVTSTGSFAKVFANHYVGDASQMTNVFVSSGSVSGSAQLATAISGAFNAGFEFLNAISGSATSTGSFGKVTSLKYTGDASQMTNVPVTTDTVSGSAQLASRISGSFNTGFVLEGTISGSMTSTASFHTVNANSYVVTNEPDINTPLQQLTTIVSSSAQISTAISGSFTSGFEFSSGNISGSVTSTGSFSRLVATKLAGDASKIADLPFDGIVSSSAQLATAISGAFTRGFEYTGTISGSKISTGSFAVVDATTFVGDFPNLQANEAGHFSSSMQVGGGTFLDDEPSLLSTNRICGSFSTNIYFGGDQITSSYFVGVSGSTFHYVKNNTTMSISSLCGSDYDHRLFDSGDRTTSYNRIGQDISPKHTTSGWSNAAGLVQGARNHHMVVGTSGAALAIGGCHTPTPSPSVVATTEKYDGATWSVSANTAAARANAGSAGGSQNAALIFGGRVTSTAATATTERYNGSTWSEVNDMPTTSPASTIGGFGTQNDAYAQIEVSEATDGQNFDGTSWSESAAHNVLRHGFGINGTSTAGIMVGAYSTNISLGGGSEIYDGVSWSSTVNLPSCAVYPTVSGTANSAHVQGNHAQYNGGRTYYHWDGTAYQSTHTMNFKRGFAHKSGAGVSSNNLFIGGTDSNNNLSTKTTCTEHFQTIYTNTGSFHAIFANRGGYQAQHSRSIDTSGVTYDFGGNFPTAQTLSTLASDISGSFTSGFEFSGNISGSITSTGSLSIFKADTVVTDNMSVGSFTDTNQMPYQSSSFNSHTNKPFIIPYVADQYYDTRQYVPTGSGHLYSCGSCTDFSNGYNTADGQLSIGRDGILNISFQSSSFSKAGAGVDAGKTLGAFSALPDMVTGTRANTFGSTNAAVVVSGTTTQAENTPTAHVQHFNGISWRRGPDILEAKAFAGNGQGWGQNESDVSMNRSANPGAKRNHLQYDGHAWWYMNCNNTTEAYHGSAGSQNAAVIWGGDGTANDTEEWNGHAWSAGANVPNGGNGKMGAGTQNAAIAGARSYPGNNTSTDLYNGTTWSSGPNGVLSSNGEVAGINGFQNDAIAKDASKAATWDGVAWAKTGDTDVARGKSGVAGTSARSIIPGGGSEPGSSLASVIEWNNSFNTGSFLTTKKIGSNFS